MPEDKSLTPERQLLNLIEKPDAGQSLRAAKIKHRGLSIFSPVVWLSRISFLKNRSKQWFKITDIQQLDIKLINNILALSMVYLGFYFIFDFSRSLVNLKEMPNLKFKFQQTAGLKASEVASLLKAATYYSEVARRRNIFKIGAVQAEGRPDIKTPSSKLKEATLNLRLVGIAWSQDPDVMIEDTKERRTYFLKRGQTMDNGVKLQAVFKDKVILGYQGEELEFK